MRNALKVFLGSLLGAVSIQVVLVACGASDPTASAGTTACDLGAHSFRQTQAVGCVASDWSFSARADGLWDATEVGCANATGVATYENGLVTVLWSYTSTDFHVGDYQWPLDASCKGGPGRAWGLIGGPVPSTFTLVQ